MKDNVKIKGFKGFDKDLKCKDKQYDVNKTFEEDVNPKTCEKGMHFCENPFDVFYYYPPNNSRYCEVDGSGEIEKNDDKVSCSKLSVKTEIGLSGIIKAGVKFIFNKVKWSKKASATGNYSGASATGDDSGASATGNYSGASATGNCSGASATGNCSGASATGNCSGASATGNCSGASATGDYSGASATGYKSGASATGNYSGASATGDYSGASATGNCSGASATGSYSGASAGKGSVALATGYMSKAKGDIGAFIVLTECEEIDNKYYIKDVKVAKVDGKSIKPNTWYNLINGEFVEYK